VPFSLESLSAQDYDDSGDKKPWSDLNGVDEWIEGVEYAVPRPPKKPGGWIAVRRQLSLVLSLVLFLVLGSGSFSVSWPLKAKTYTIQWFHPEPWSLCVRG
jgi:hypothetical protein